MRVVGLLHPGEMGASIGAALRRAGVEVLWASAGRGPATRRRAQAAGLTDAGTLPVLVTQSDADRSGQAVPPGCTCPAPPPGRSRRCLRPPSSRRSRSATTSRPPRR